MKSVHGLPSFSQQQLKELLEDVYKRGKNATDVTSKQVVDEIAVNLKKMIKSEPLNGKAIGGVVKGS